MVEPTAAAGHQTGAKAALISTTESHRPGTRFRECPRCPEMIVVPSGHFDKAIFLPGPGKSSTVETTISNSFAVGIYDVTHDQYAAFVEATAHVGGEGCEILDPTGRWITAPQYSWRNPGFPQSNRDPVVCVSWEDAQAYVGWLNSEVRTRGDVGSESRQGPYRLLTGDEWEWAAGGDNAPPQCYSGNWHECANFGAPQCYPCGGAILGNDRWLYTSPVGSFTPNVFGLYDVIGDVWQWTDECYNQKDDPWFRNQNISMSDDCSQRILRGISWNDAPPRGSISLGVRNNFPKGSRNYANGFRVARDLP
jgi:formylglycine-generating enzyme